MKAPFAIALVVAACTACGGGTTPGSARNDTAAADDSSTPADDPRTIPDPACAADYGGTTGVINYPEDPGAANPLEDGEPASVEVAATLPAVIHLRGRTETFTDAYYFAARDGNVYVTANREVTGADEPWRQLALPGCLDGQVTELSADGNVLIALDRDRNVYTLDYSRLTTGSLGWTRRWGPFFWADFGIRIFADVRDWATSEFTGTTDGTFTDSAGNEQEPAGILTVYLLRGDERRITYIDPWLPVDESREVCTPQRGTTRVAGLSGSGSTVMIVTAAGEIYTRLYEFDVSGANTVFLDYAWEDQRGVADPLIQLPPPDWIHHPRVPGTITDRISLRKVSPGSTHRIMRIEGTDASGNAGYWQKDQAETAASAWQFVVTGEPLQGRKLPLETTPALSPEDFGYSGTIDGYPAQVTNFNPYCSPAALRISFGDGDALDLVLHTTDGLRQERRARGLDGNPHNYRSAVEVPQAVWDDRANLSAAAADFLATHFADSRFLDGPVYATLATLEITEPCWVLHRDSDVPDALIPETVPDLGIVVSDRTSEQEEGRLPGACTDL